MQQTQKAATKDTTVDAIYTASKQAVADGTATDAQKALVKAYDKVTDLLADANTRMLRQRRQQI